MGFKQACPLKATLFGLFVDGLDQHLMDTLGHDAPSLSGVLICYCYTLMTSPSCLQRQQGYSGSLMHGSFAASNENAV